MEENKAQNKNVQTYADDMAEVIGSNENGMIKNIIHQEEEYEAVKKNLSPESKKNRLFIFASMLFLILAVLIISYLMVFKEKIQTVEVQAQFTPLVVTNKTAFLEVGGFTKAQIVQSVLNEIAGAEVKANGAEGIYLTENKNIVGFPRFLVIMEANLAKGKAGIFGNNFLIGSVNQDTKNPFILFQVKFFSDAFNEMRAWEEKMFFDMHDFFSVAVNADTNYLLTKDFEDGIIQNKNARILYDSGGKIVLMYIFVDDTSIIIGNTEEAVSEVMIRLAASRIKK